jgi:hypothetical protein
MKNEEAAKPQKSVYAAPTLRKQQLLEEVLGQVTLTTHGPVGSPSPSPTPGT